MSAPEPTATAPRKESDPKPPFIRTEDTTAYRNLAQTLAESNKWLADARARLASVEQELRTVVVEKEKLDKDAFELRQRVGELTKVVETAEKSLHSNDDRVTNLENSNRRLRDESKEQVQRLSRLTKLVTEMEDIGKRREASANNLLSRYREVTEQYRSLALATNGGASGDPGLSRSLDLSRIQQIISTAEEDLRQLRALNAQVASLQRKISEASR